MFIPNSFAMVYRRGGYNLYGEPSFEEPVRVPCGVVSLDVISEKTAVRTDSSASRGNANELITKSRLLFPTGFNLALGDKVEFDGVMLVITEIFPRRDMSGKVDHLDCVLQIWSEP